MLRYIIQKYIEKPLLINNRKFDIRIWCLVTHNMDIYVYKEGYIRTYLFNNKPIVPLLI